MYKYACMNVALRISGILNNYEIFLFACVGYLKCFIYVYSSIYFPIHPLTSLLFFIFIFTFINFVMKA